MAKDFTLLLAPNASLMTGPGTNTIIVGDGVEGATVIDPGSADSAHLEAIIDAGAERGGIRRILITHGHPDHVEGAEELRAELDVRIYAYSRAGVPCADEELPDNFLLPAGDDTLRGLYTPGHRFDHLCFLLERKRILFAGDLLSGIGTNVIAPPEGDMRAYLASLRRLQQMDLVEIVPGHGPIIPDAQTRLAEYIAHRQLREQQVIEELRDRAAPVSASTLVERIYADVNPQLHSLAEQSLTAHLLKLEYEGKVQRQGECWLLL